MADTPVADFRNKLLTHAKELNETLRAIIDPVRQVLNALDAEADRLKAHLEHPGTRKVEDLSTLVPAAVAPPPTTDKPELPPGKRGCGICGQPGHRRTTCPRADEVYKAQRSQTSPPVVVKKERKPLSPERKAQLAETLKKARASKGKKGR